MFEDNQEEHTGPSDEIEAEEQNIEDDTTEIIAYARKNRNKKQKMIGTTEKHQMVKRDKMKLKRTAALLSPFLNRVIDASDNVYKTEKEFYFWIMHNETADMEEVVFKNKGMNIRRCEMLTLKEGEFISSAILDVWSVILNNKEDLRAAESPCRFFATTDPCCYPVANQPQIWDTKTMQTNFLRSSIMR